VSVTAERRPAFPPPLAGGPLLSYRATRLRAMDEAAIVTNAAADGFELEERPLAGAWVWGWSRGDDTRWPCFRERDPGTPMDGRSATTRPSLRVRREQSRRRIGPSAWRPQRFPTQSPSIRAAHAAL
jgi:hypothetical protein